MPSWVERGCEGVELRYCEPILKAIEERIKWSKIEAIRGGFYRLFAALAAGSLTGYDYCFDIVMEKYYEYKDVLGESAFYVTRFYPLYSFFVDAVEAAIEFEEALSDSRRVFLAEPILVAAIKSLCLEGGMSGFRRVSFTNSSSRYFIVEVGGKKGRVRAPFPLYALALLAVSRFFPQGVFRPCSRASGVLVAPDPAFFRDYLFRARPQLEELGVFAYRSLMRECSRIEALKGVKSVSELCGEEGVVAVGYEVKGFYWRVWYVCS